MIITSTPTATCAALIAAHLTVHLFIYPLTNLANTLLKPCAKSYPENSLLNNCIAEIAVIVLTNAIKTKTFINLNRVRYTMNLYSKTNITILILFIGLSAINTAQADNIKHPTLVELITAAAKNIKPSAPQTILTPTYPQQEKPSCPCQNQNCILN